MNWYATRHDDYARQLLGGMRRSNPRERARERILTDDELQLLWSQSDNQGTFGGLVRMLLLTAQRRETVAAMRWSDVAVDGTWLIPGEDRAKRTGGELVLPAMAHEIIKAQPRFPENPFVVAGRGGSHLKGYSKAKAIFDATVHIPKWQLHDLRRTARSLMSVRPDIAERVLSHSIKGV
jgi:integrase